MSACVLSHGYVPLENMLRERREGLVLILSICFPDYTYALDLFCGCEGIAG